MPESGLAISSLFQPSNLCCHVKSSLRLEAFLNLSSRSFSVCVLAVPVPAQNFAIFSPKDLVSEVSIFHVVADLPGKFPLTASHGVICFPVKKLCPVAASRGALRNGVIAWAVYISGLE